MPIGVSAQEYETIDDYSNGNNNEMVESYSYDEPNIYNADDGYNNVQNSEYSTYNSYEPTSYGNSEQEYSSYDDYEYLYSEYLEDDNSNSYEKDNNGYYENSYDKNYYPPKEPKKFTCPDSGIVVDKQENCPIVCPAGSALEGHFVKAGSDVQKVCNEEELQTCGTGTDLEGVKVSNASEDCDLFFECTANTPLGRSLDLPTGGSVEVADPQLCQLTVGDQISTTTCEAATSTNPLMVGAEVTDERLCDAATPAVQCGDNTTLEGVWVHPEQETEICDLSIPQFAQCEFDSPLGQSLGLESTDPPLQVADSRLCELVTVCGDDTNMAGAFVIDEQLCAAPDDDNLCTTGELAGVYVNDPTTDCDIPEEPLVTNFEAQCLKCADLAALQANEVISPTGMNPFPVPPGQNAQLQASVDLIGDNAADANVFTICNDPLTASAEFNSTITIPTAAGGAMQENRIEAAFELCTNNAPEPTEDVQVEPSSLQENSLTTNVKSEDEIPTFSNQTSLPLFSPPSIALGEGDSSASDKIEKLKQQWLDLLP
jgi:hypothetical protein